MTKLSARQVDALTIIAHTGVIDEIDGRTLTSLRKRGLVELAADKGSTLLTVSGTTAWESTTDRRRAAVFAKAELEAYEIESANKPGVPSEEVTVEELTTQIDDYLSGYVFDIAGIVRDIISAYGPVSKDSIPESELDVIIRRYDVYAHDPADTPIEEIPECVTAAAALTESLYHLLIDVHSGLNRPALHSQPGGLLELERRGLAHRITYGMDAYRFDWSATDLGRQVLAVRPVWHAA